MELWMYIYASWCVATSPNWSIPNLIKGFLRQKMCVARMCFPKWNVYITRECKNLVRVSLFFLARGFGVDLLAIFRPLFVFLVCACVSFFHLWRTGIQSKTPPGFETERLLLCINRSHFRHVEFVGYFIRVIVCFFWEHILRRMYLVCGNTSSH